MATHTITGYITYDGGYMPRGESPVSFSTYKPDAKYSPKTVVVREHSFTVDVPKDFDPRGQLVENLEEHKAQLRAEFAAKVVQIDRQIASLLALDNGVAA